VAPACPPRPGLAPAARVPRRSACPRAHLANERAYGRLPAQVARAGEEIALDSHRHETEVELRSRGAQPEAGIGKACRHRCGDREMRELLALVAGDLGGSQAALAQQPVEPRTGSRTALAVHESHPGAREVGDVLDPLRI